jgi:hypothetical protein
MKSKLCLLLVMFLIWCLFNWCTIWVLEKVMHVHDGGLYSPVYYFIAVLFSAFNAFWQEDFKFYLVSILVAELCWLIILWIQGNENGVGYDPITFFNNSFFVLVGYLTKVGAYWAGYCAGWLGLANGLALLVCEMIMLGLSFILILPIRKLSIWLTDKWMGEDEAWSPFTMGD